jgi:hypothetical protein
MGGERGERGGEVAEAARGGERWREVARGGERRREAGRGGERWPRGEKEGGFYLYIPMFIPTEQIRVHRLQAKDFIRSLEGIYTLI